MVVLDNLQISTTYKVFIIKNTMLNMAIPILSVAQKPNYTLCSLISVLPNSGHFGW